MDERRRKIVSIDKALLVAVFNWWRDPPHWLALPVTDELPEDCRVVSVHFCHRRECFEAIVESESFPPVDNFCELPVVGFVDEFRIVQFPKPESV